LRKCLKTMDLQHEIGTHPRWDVGGPGDGRAQFSGGRNGETRSGRPALPLPLAFQATIGISARPARRLQGNKPRIGRFSRESLKMSRRGADNRT